MSSQYLKSVTIPGFGGVNPSMGWNVAKTSEPCRMENMRPGSVGNLETRDGIANVGMTNLALVSSLWYFPVAGTSGIYGYGQTDTGTKIVYLNTAGTAWNALTAAITPQHGNHLDTVVTDDRTIIAGDVAKNRQIEKDGVTVKSSTDKDSHLYGSPIANKVNFYRSLLYLGDLTVGSSSYSTTVQFSSGKLGIAAKVSEDAPAGAVKLKVTETKYIRTDLGSEALEIRRGNELVGYVTANSSGSGYLDVGATSVDALAGDDLWLSGTYSGDRYHRWSGGAETGAEGKRYDTFEIPGGNGERITMMQNVGGVMAIATPSTSCYWDGSSVIPAESGVGCCSDEGYVLHMGNLFFLDYTGLYVTPGASAPKLVSARVDRYFRAASKANLERAAVGKKGNSVFVSIGSIYLYDDDGKRDDSEIKDVCLEYDLVKDEWYVHTGVPATCFENVSFGNVLDRLIFGTDRGLPQSNYSGPQRVCEFLKQGQLTDTDGTGTYPVSTRLDTNRMLLPSRDEACVNLGKVAAFLDAGNSLQVFTRTDDEKAWRECDGQFDKGVTFAVVKDCEGRLGARCRSAQFSLRSVSKGKTRISRLRAYFDDMDEVADEGKNER
jgi:hypothetical protein